MGTLNLETIKEGWLGPNRLSGSNVPGLVFSIQGCERVCVPLSGHAKEQRPEKSARNFLLYGRSHGDFHVPLWRVGGLRKEWRMGQPVFHLDGQYSQELYHGAAVPADYRRAFGEDVVPESISRGDGAGGAGWK